MKQQNGFTIIEIILVVTVMAVASVFFFIQKNEIEAASRDSTRKTAINAMYYSLEEVYFKQHNAYPRTLSSEILPSVDADLFKDPFGVKIGDGESDYRYEPTSCNENLCQKYTLRTTLENEADYVKESRNGN